MLVVLAASPVTAPFSTCDLGTLLGCVPTLLASAGTTALSVAAAPTNGDAYSISPVLVRIELRHQPAAAAITVPDPRHGSRLAPISRRSFRDLDRSPRDPSQQITVLRL
jgi:hypothetical protein